MYNWKGTAYIVYRNRIIKYSKKAQIGGILICCIKMNKEIYCATENGKKLEL